MRLFPGWARIEKSPDFHLGKTFFADLGVNLHV